MRHSKQVLIAFLCSLCFFSISGAIPQMINFQGIVTNGAGAPINGPFDIVQFTIWDDSVGGTAIWSVERTDFAVTNGLFTVLLGSVVPIPDSVFNGANRYLGVSLDGGVSEQSPRTRLVAVAYAFRVASVDGATGGTIISKVSIGPGHTNTGFNAFVAGDNGTASGDWSTVSGGLSNEASATGTTVGGGETNTAGDSHATVGGGHLNAASGSHSTVAGGLIDTASGNRAAIGGGQFNKATGDYSFIGGGGGLFPGDSNVASGDLSVIVGGRMNVASDSAATVGGGSNNVASGSYSTIPGGTQNTASGSCSFAAGTQAQANHDGSFVWADPGTAGFASTDTNQFLIRASGGVGIGTASPGFPLEMASGAHVTTGGTWTNASDRNLKEHFTPVDRQALLENIAELSIERWNYKNENESVQHIGPVAQDFYALFGVGGNDKSISSIDPAGIALAAIQELHRQHESLADRNLRLEAEVTELRSMIQVLLMRE